MVQTAKTLRLRTLAKVKPGTNVMQYKIMIILTKLNELAHSEDVQIQRRFWGWCFVGSLIFTGLIGFTLKYSEFIKASGTIELQFKVLLIIGLIINATTLLINYMVSTDD